jgi:hypothetical protein
VVIGLRSSGVVDPRLALASAPPVLLGRHLVAGEFDDIRARLEAISEELADLAIERLRESIDAGGTELPVDERRLTRARRAVDKAISLLQEPDHEPFL